MKKSRISIFLGLLLFLSIFHFFSVKSHTTGELDTELSVKMPPEIIELELKDHSESDEIDLNPGESIEVTCEGIVKSFYEWESISNGNVWAQVYFDGEKDNIDDDSVHLGINNSCSLEEIGNHEVEVSCDFEMKHYSKPGDWKCFLEVEDIYGWSDNKTTSNQVTELLAFGYSNEEIDFGTLGWGDENIRNREIQNLGNVEFDIGVNVSGDEQIEDSSMICESGYLSNSNFKSGLDSSFENLNPVENGINLGLSATVGNSENPIPNQDLFFGLKVPSDSNIEGSCTGNLILNILYS